jgi:hypothetical protein
MNLSKLSINQLNELTGLDRRTITAKLKKAELPFEEGPNNSHLYETPKALAILFNAKEEDTVFKQIEKEDLRYQKARADKAELDLAERRREVIPITEIVSAIETEYSFVRAQVNTLGPALGKQVAIETDPIKCAEIISNATELILNQLQADKKYADIAANIELHAADPSGDSAESAEAETEAEHGGVGGSGEIPQS